MGILLLLKQWVRRRILLWYQEWSSGYLLIVARIAARLDRLLVLLDLLLPVQLLIEVRQERRVVYVLALLRVVFGLLGV